jgi:hypothetical protein
MPFSVVGLVHVARWVNITICMFVQKFVRFLNVLWAMYVYMSGKGVQMSLVLLESVREREAHRVIVYKYIMK